jgi:hypothetical protein
MKKIIILALALAGATGSALCQQTIAVIGNPKISKTDLMFYDQFADPPRIKFEFNMPYGNKMSVECVSLYQLDSIPKLDSLIALIKTNLDTLIVTGADPLYNRRVDYLITNIDTKVRIRSYPPAGEIFSFRKNKGVTQLKVEQDTLAINLYTLNAEFDPKRKTVYGRWYRITFYVNNLSDLDKLPFEKLEASIEQLRNEIRPAKLKEKKYSGQTYYAAYDVNTGKKLVPYAGQNNYKVRFNSNPYVQSGLQFMRGAFVPSFAAGIELVQKRSEKFERQWRLAWEPLFFFSRDMNNKVVMERNDFIMFKQHSESTWRGAVKEIKFVQNASVGYLIRRKGNWLEKHTIKFALPTGIQYENILLEPEFIFNDFFKNFSPSLKFTVIFG